MCNYNNNGIYIKYYSIIVILPKTFLYSVIIKQKMKSIIFTDLIVFNINNRTYKWDYHIYNYIIICNLIYNL